MFKFLTHRPFWVNLLAAIALALLMVFVFLQLLGVITKHGKHLTVPSVMGKSTAEAVRFLEEKGFVVIIQDSIYTDTAKMGIVLKQLPDPNSTVKINRTVFLTVNRVTLPLVEMPSLEGKTFNYALIILERSHLTLGDTSTKPDFMRGSVMEQLYKGKRVQYGTKVPWGSRIDLVIAGGLSEERFLVPSVVGLTLSEATTLLEAAGLSVGATIPLGIITDTASAYVYKQNPPKLTTDQQPLYIKSGQLMDLFISQQMIVVDSTATLSP